MLCICIHNCILTKKRTNQLRKKASLKPWLIKFCIWSLLKPAFTISIWHLRAPVSKQLHSWRWLSQEAYVFGLESPVVAQTAIQKSRLGVVIVDIAVVCLVTGLTSLWANQRVAFSTGWVGLSHSTSSVSSSHRLHCPFTAGDILFKCLLTFGIEDAICLILVGEGHVPVAVALECAQQFTEFS